MHPKISGLFNNCVLNCALPTLFQNIRKLSTQELEAYNFEAGSKELAIYQNYCMLKDVFCTYYRVEPLSFAALTAFIDKHQFSELEIIFAPVLRHFIAEHGEKNNYSGNIAQLRDISEGHRFDLTWRKYDTLRELEEEEFTDELISPMLIFCKGTDSYYVYGHAPGVRSLGTTKDQFGHISHPAWGLRKILNQSLVNQWVTEHAPTLKHTDYFELPYRTEIKALCREITTAGLHIQQQTGRYNDLSLQEAHQLLYKPFNIGLRCIDAATQNMIEERAANVLVQGIFSAPNNEPLTVYFIEAQHHYELNHGLELSQATQQYNNEIEALNGSALGDIYDQLSFTNNGFETNQCLGQLNRHVHHYCTHELPTQNASITEISVQDYLIFGKRFHNHSRLGRQTFAVIMLVLLEETVKDASFLLSRIENFSHTAEADELCHAILAGEGMLDTEAITLADNKLKALENAEIQRLQAIKKWGNPVPVDGGETLPNNHTPTENHTINTSFQLAYWQALAGVSVVMSLLAITLASPLLGYLALSSALISCGLFATKRYFSQNTQVELNQSIESPLPLPEMP